MGESDLKELEIGLSLEEYVLKLAIRARGFGCDGVVCSGKEVAMIKRELGPEFLVVTPGIRPEWSVVAGEDQKRIVTPRQAFLNGADYIVVGRPIRTSPDPLEAAWKIREEIDAALGEIASGANRDGTKMSAAR